MKLDAWRERTPPPFFPLTAMIDVLFLMIIFLVLGASFDAVLSVELPQGRGAAVADGVARLEVAADGRVWWEGRPHAPEAAAPLIAELRARRPASLLLLPHRRLDVERLFLWHDLLGRGVEVPVAVGVEASPGAASR